MTICPTFVSQRKGRTAFAAHSSSKSKAILRALGCSARSVSQRLLRALGSGASRPRRLQRDGGGTASRRSRITSTCLTGACASCYTSSLPRPRAPTGAGSIGPRGSCARDRLLSELLASRRAVAMPVVGVVHYPLPYPRGPRLSDPSDHVGQTGLTEVRTRGRAPKSSAAHLAQSSAVSFPSMPKRLGTHRGVGVFPQLVRRLRISTMAPRTSAPDPSHRIGHAQWPPWNPRGWCNFGFARFTLRRSLPPDTNHTALHQRPPYFFPGGIACPSILPPCGPGCTSCRLLGLSRAAQLSPPPTTLPPPSPFRSPSTAHPSKSSSSHPSSSWPLGRSPPVGSTSIFPWSRRCGRRCRYRQSADMFADNTAEATTARTSLRGWASEIDRIGNTLVPEHSGGFRRLAILQHYEHVRWMVRRMKRVQCRTNGAGK